MDTKEHERASTVEIERARVPLSWWVEVQDDAGGRSVPLAPGTTHVGSARDNTLRVADGAVSARHLELELVAEGVVVRDCGSKNGTFVGPARVTEVLALAGATITVGRSTLVLGASHPECFTPEDADPLPHVVGASAAMRRVAGQVRRLARLRHPVLVSGESGTGKELMARALHSEGPRASKPLVAINVASIPRELVESEFFGHERGAFTGAVARRRGAFEEAERGTLFLDEIGELPPEAQPKLLRALDGYSVRTVGGAGATQPRDVRIVAATHVPLAARVAEGRFRRDLFHRLEVFTVRLPPLRERRGDIGPIARAMLRGMDRDLGRKDLTSAAIAWLGAASWPGNVRELRNVLLRAAALAEGPVVGLAHLEAASSGAVELDRPRLSPDLAKAVLREHEGNLSAAARAAGLPRTTFRKLLVR